MTGALSHSISRCLPSCSFGCSADTVRRFTYYCGPARRCQRACIRCKKSWVRNYVSLLHMKTFEPSLGMFVANQTKAVVVEFIKSIMLTNACRTNTAPIYLPASVTFVTVHAFEWEIVDWKIVENKFKFRQVSG